LRGRAAALGRQPRVRGPGRRQAVLRPGLLRPRQRRLQGLGRDLARQGQVRGVAGGVVSWEPDEMMSIAAARELRDVNACFVGIGLPSTGANLARLTHSPDLVLVYEAGAIGAKPHRLPLSIGDGILGETADYIAAVPEIFNYWVRPGRIDV